jgi:NAD(P)-dependent dehydrogenase (short-subunit alcohol dehydrogenase family)
LLDIKKLQKIIKKIVLTKGTIHSLINNAANDERHTTQDVDEKYYENRMSINLKHYFFAAQEVVKGMKKIKNGSIVNLSSVSWVLGEGDKVIYETAKSGVIGLTRSFAQEYGKYNIRTNSVVPGSIATERQIKYWLTPKYKKQILEKQALKRQLKPEDVARLVLFLSSDQSSGCTKQSFVVDAGIT